MIWVHWSNLVDTGDGPVTHEQEIMDVEAEVDNKDDEGGGSENEFFDHENQEPTIHEDVIHLDPT